MRQVLNQARADGRRPRVHGNGFVQLDLNDVSRMHLFGHPEVPSQKTYTGIHDHRFSFHSQVLTGCLRHTEYHVVGHFERLEPATHAVYTTVQVPDSRDTKLYSTGDIVALYPLPTRYYRKGMFYRFEMRDVHDTQADEPTLTLINKTANDPAHKVRVFVPLGFAPDNDFKREAHDEDVLWRLLEEAVGRI